MFTKACLSLSLIVSLTTLASAQTRFGLDRPNDSGADWGYRYANSYRPGNTWARYGGRTDHPVNWGNYEAVGVRGRGWGGSHGGYTLDRDGYVSSALRNELFTRDLWIYLTSGSSAYKHWDAFPGKDARMQESRGHHGPNILIYANQMVQSLPKALSYQSIIVLENYAQDSETLDTIDVMSRYDGFDPSFNDWYWTRYSKIGSVAYTSLQRTGSPLAGRVASCIRCHTKADGGDLVYSND